MKNWLKITMTTVVALSLSSATLLAQTTLKWAHVYETSEPLPHLVCLGWGAN